MWAPFEIEETETQKIFPKNIQLVSGTTRIWTQVVWFQGQNLHTVWIKRREKRDDREIFLERLNDLISVLVIRGKIQIMKTYVQITSNAISDKIKPQESLFCLYRLWFRRVKLSYRIKLKEYNKHWYIKKSNKQDAEHYGRRFRDI